MDFQIKQVDGYKDFQQVAPHSALVSLLDTKKKRL